MLMDALNLEFDESSFEAVLDKGTFDSILCGDSNYITQVLGEIHRVLTPTGTFLCISYASPEFRMRHLEKFDWQVTVHQVPKPPISATAVLASEDPDFPNVHFIYACKKAAEISNSS
jgi:ubiquinone/menaquinone biosynthesis C-methylase UbiE